MNKKTNKPSENKAGAGTPKKPAGMGMMIGIAITVLVVLIGIISMFVGGGGKQAPQDKEKQEVATSDTASTGKKQPKVYETENRVIKNTESRFAPNNEPPVSTSELVYFTEPVTGVQMVQTPSGAISVDSPEGQKYIADFKALQLASGPQQPDQGLNQSQALVAKAEIESIKQTTNEQVMALDAKINDLAGQVDSLIALSKKQNETIEKLAYQIKTIQPITKSSTELAKDLFGKNGDKVLKERNTAIAVDSIVGNKAYITTKDGKTTLVGVGDIIQGTSVKIKKIDPSTNTVLVAE